MSFYTPCVDKIRCLLNFMLLCVLDRLPVQYTRRRRPRLASNFEGRKHLENLKPEDLKIFLETILIIDQETFNL